MQVLLHTILEKYPSILCTYFSSREGKRYQNAKKIVVAIESPDGKKVLFVFLYCEHITLVYLSTLWKDDATEPA